MERRKPKYQIIDGVPRCLGVDPDILRENLKFKAKAGDVVESTFPKSGTHWVQFIIQLILKKGEAITSHKDFADNMRLLEYSRCQDWTPSLPMRTFFSHLPLNPDTITPEGKYVYVARNPWDVCVSFFHMATNLSSCEYQDATFEEFAHAFLDGNFGYGDYFEHVASGYALKDRPNVFFLTYEKLKMDKKNVVLRLAHFLGEEYGKALESDEALLEKLLERSSPESMKRVVVIDLKDNPNKEMQEVLSRNKIKCKEGYGGDENKYGIVREAKVGGWREYFTPELLHKMERKICEVEKKSPFIDLWKDIRAQAIEASRCSG